MRRWREGDWYLELAIAVIVAVLGGASAWVDDPGDSGIYGPIPAAVAVAAGLVLAARRVAPLTVLGCVLTLMLVVSIADHQVGSSPVALLFASHAVGRWAPVPRAWWGLGAIWGFFAVLAASGDDYFTQPVALVQPFVYAVPFAVGRYVAVRATHVDEERETARQAERARVARELHDIVSHALTGISVQAATARHLRLDGDEAHAAFSTIETASRHALADLRRMLDVLRADSSAAGSPSPGVEDLAELVAQHVETHGDVDLVVADDLSTLEPSVGLAVYRMVQESLTNVAKHAHGAPATVRVRRVGREIEVEIEDAGGGTVTALPGSYGIIGMRERAAVFGGSVEAGPRAEGGFRVVARIPSRP